MWNYGWHMAGMWWGGLIFVLVIAATVWLVGAAVGTPQVRAGGADDPETLLKRRYARGDIDRDEYRRRLDDLKQ